MRDELIASQVLRPMSLLSLNPSTFLRSISLNTAISMPKLKFVRTFELNQAKIMPQITHTVEQVQENGSSQLCNFRQDIAWKHNLSPKCTRTIVKQVRTQLVFHH